MRSSALARLGYGVPLATKVSAPVPSFLRLHRLGRRARLTLGAAALGGLIAVLATARAAQIEPAPSRPEPVAVAEDPEPVIDPAWVIDGTPVQRVGYRHGRRHTFEVVPLGPAAVEVELTTARAFLDMRGAAAEVGIELRLVSGFRTAEQQRALFRAWKKGRGNKAARPGMSNHQSGRALDIAVNSVPGAFEWLERHGPTYGFKRTVASEPWHWEYVDVPIARGAIKRVSRKSAKAAKAAKTAKRPAKRGTAPRATVHRVASTRR
jgi:hypothetical protein